MRKEGEGREKREERREARGERRETRAERREKNVSMYLLKSTRQGSRYGMLRDIKSRRMRGWEKST
ncbi:hypothetical protein EAF00_003725 [Botryotinia globosa]|nr:hypothetical protein EAF00_003725 [Botryotinia globosa]